MALVLTYLLVFIIGSIFGSLVNVVVYRLPSVTVANIRPNATQSLFYLAWPLSFCPHCSEPIKPWNNIPVLSYLLLAGKSPCCGKSIAVRYPILELLGAMLALLCLLRFGLTSQFLFACVFCWLLLAIAVIDARSYILPDILIQPFLWLGLLANLNGVFVSLPDAVTGAIGAYVFLFIVSEGCVIVLGKRMLGAGDPKLFAALGAWLGWQLLPGALVIAAIFASVYGLVHQVLVQRKLRNLAFVAFGPHLALGGIVMLLLGHVVVDLYLQQ